MSAAHSWPCGEIDYNQLLVSCGVLGFATKTVRQQTDIGAGYPKHWMFHIWLAKIWESLGILRVLSLAYIMDGLQGLVVTRGLMDVLFCQLHTWQVHAQNNWFIFWGLPVPMYFPSIRAGYPNIFQLKLMFCSGIETATHISGMQRWQCDMSLVRSHLAVFDANQLFVTVGANNLPGCIGHDVALVWRRWGRTWYTCTQGVCCVSLTHSGA